MPVSMARPRIAVCVVVSVSCACVCPWCGISFLREAQCGSTTKLCVIFPCANLRLVHASVHVAVVFGFWPLELGVCGGALASQGMQLNALYLVRCCPWCFMWQIPVMVVKASWLRCHCSGMCDSYQVAHYETVPGTCLEKLREGWFWPRVCVRR